MVALLGGAAGAEQGKAAEGQGEEKAFRSAHDNKRWVIERGIGNLAEVRRKFKLGGRAEIDRRV